MSDLFRSDNVVVRSVPASDLSRWVVTFDNYGIGHGFDRAAFGEDFLRKEGIAAIHVLGVREDWYQYAEMAEAMRAVRQATAGAERVMTYGSSMGGYAALRFADAAGANAVLALSPQYSIDPQKAAFEKRWLQDSQRIQWLPEIDGVLTSEAKPVVAFDPSGDDLLHVQLIEESIAISRIELPYCGHPATTVLGEMGLLGPVVLQGLDGSLDVEGMRREARLRRRVSSVHHMRLANLQPPVRVEWGMKLARRALELAPHNAGAMAALAARLGQTGQHEEALALYEAALAQSNRDPVYLVALADALVTNGRAKEAVALAEETVRRHSAYAHLWYWLAVIRWEANHREEAVAAITKAIELHPQLETYRLTLDYYHAEMAPPSQLSGSPAQEKPLRRFRMGIVGWFRGQGRSSRTKADSAPR